MVTTRSHTKDYSLPSSSAKKRKCNRKSSESKNKIDKEVVIEEQQEQLEFTTQDTQEASVKINGENDYENSLLDAPDSNARFDLFKKILLKLIKFGSNTNISSYEKYDNFCNLYKLINFYFRVFDNEFFYKDKSTHISKSRFKLGKQIYAKAQEVRDYLIKNNDINTPIGIELNIQVVEYIKMWMINEYQWREGTRETKGATLPFNPWG